jgi:hypothetical protein
METSFPDGDAASLTLTLRAPKRFTLAVRRPSWAGDGFSVRVNGAIVSNASRPGSAAPGSYVELSRTWKTGDRVTLVLPKALHLETAARRDGGARAAILWGPLVLAGDLGPEPPRKRDVDEDDSQPGAVDVPLLVTDGRPLTEWIKPLSTSSSASSRAGSSEAGVGAVGSGRPGEFRTVGVGRDRDVTLAPFYRVQRRTYAAYWDLLTPAEYEKKGAEIAAERARQRALEAMTVAFAQPGEMQPERDFHQQGDASTPVRVDGRAGRRGSKWFSFDLPVDPAAPLALVATYHSDNRRTRTFEILIDGQHLADQTIDAAGTSRFFDVTYAIPPDLVRDKSRVTVRFQATNGNEIASVFGLRVIRTNAGAGAAR